LENLLPDCVGERSENNLSVKMKPAVEHFDVTITTNAKDF